MILQESTYMRNWALVWDLGSTRAALRRPFDVETQLHFVSFSHLDRERALSEISQSFGKPLSMWRMGIISLEYESGYTSDGEVRLMCARYCTLPSRGNWRCSSGATGLAATALLSMCDEAMLRLSIIVPRRRLACFRGAANEKCIISALSHFFVRRVGESHFRSVYSPLQPSRHVDQSLDVG